MALKTTIDIKMSKQMGAFAPHIQVQDSSSRASNSDYIQGEHLVLEHYHFEYKGGHQSLDLLQLCYQSFRVVDHLE